VKLVAFAAELGQGDELKGIEDKARKSGADEVVVMDLRQEFAEKYCFPMLRTHAIYEQQGSPRGGSQGVGPQVPKGSPQGVSPCRLTNRKS
jgi:argininosuccinate synthase